MPSHTKFEFWLVLPTTFNRRTGDPTIHGTFTVLLNVWFWFSFNNLPLSSICTNISRITRVRIHNYKSLTTTDLFGPDSKIPPKKTRELVDHFIFLYLELSGGYFLLCCSRIYSRINSRSTSVSDRNFCIRNMRGRCISGL